MKPSSARRDRELSGTLQQALALKNDLAGFLERAAVQVARMAPTNSRASCAT